jgi:serine phosphatase RsbU (regulator of sigma subunit)
MDSSSAWAAAACLSVFSQKPSTSLPAWALAPGDWLIIFTHGLEEAKNAGQDEYGETRLLAAIAAGAAGTPPESLNRLMAEVDLFVGNTPQHDT